MRKLIPLVIALVDICLLAVSAGILFTVVGLTVMVFDSGESAGSWAFFSTVASVCLLLEVIAAYLAWGYFWKKRYFKSVLGSALPLIVFGVFQAIISVI